MTYTWKITDMKTLDVDGVQNAVIQTFWQKTGTDENGKEGSFAGGTPFPVSDIDPEDFTPYEDLTEEIVLGWIKEVVVGSYEEHVNEQIQKQINQTQIKDPGLPWAPQPTPTTTPEE
jgi:hypothetical protein